MGYQRHHAIIVTSFLDENLDAAHRKAVRIFGEAASPIIESEQNGYRSFFVAPDGSKEGWLESVAGDADRNKFVKWLRGKRLDWVEVQYGDDEGQTVVVRHSDDDGNGD
jgi:hypothetical protein